MIININEPLLNLNNIVPTIKIILNDFNFNLSKHRITLSTSNIIPTLNKLNDIIDITLTISLHTPNDEIHNEIIPINKKYNIETFLTTIHRYLKKSNTNQNQITIKYIILNHINDDTKHTHQLTKLLKNTPYKINLIP